MCTIFFQQYFFGGKLTLKGTCDFHAIAFSSSVNVARLKEAQLKCKAGAENIFLLTIAFGAD
jgi:hypothetical protein